MRLQGGAIGLIIFLVIILYQTFCLDPTAKQIKNELMVMHQEINPLPGASFVEESSFVRGNGGHITYIYTATSVTPQEIIDHYDKEFRRNGWIYKETDVEHSAETNEIRKVARYIKNTHYGGAVVYPSESKTINRISIGFDFYDNR